MNTQDLILDVKNLNVNIYRDETVYKPLSGHSFQLSKGKAVGMVGESGCGKTMTAYSLLRILPPHTGVEGDMLFRTSYGSTVNLTELNPRSKQMRRIRGGEISMIFQEPMSAFCPVYTIYNQISEVIRLHCDIPKSELRNRVVELLKMVGMPEPENRVDDYPFQFSGGMLQRAMIAMALAPEPKLLIADEPTTALDVTTQAQVLKLIKNLKQNLNLSFILITHDLGVIAHMVEYIYVMYLGRVVEAAPTEELFDNPCHPYTIDLLNSIPDVKGHSRQKLISIAGTVPDTSDLPSGCCFHPRCRQKIGEVCSEQTPAYSQISDDHFVRCLKFAEQKEGMTSA